MLSFTLHYVPVISPTTYLEINELLCPEILLTDKLGQSQYFCQTLALVLFIQYLLVTQIRALVLAALLYTARHVA